MRTFEASTSVAPRLIVKTLSRKNAVFPPTRNRPKVDGDAEVEEDAACEAAIPRRRSKLAHEVNVANVERLPTTVAALDRALGPSRDGATAYGAVRGTAILMAGMPGTGKTTMLSAAAEGMQRAGERCLYVSGEEGEDVIVARARAGNLDGAPPTFHVLADDGENGAPSLEDAIAEAERLDVTVLFLDSGAVLEKERQEGEHHDAFVRTCKVAYEYAHRTGVTVFILGHATAEGGAAGATRAKHWVDVILWLEQVHGEIGVVSVEPLKNRFSSKRAWRCRMVDAGDFGRFEAGLWTRSEPSSKDPHPRSTSASSSC